MGMTLPLTGIRVLDLSRVLPGPYCTMLLADMGAEVSKVEVPGEGDLTRGQGDPESEARGGKPVFFDLNRNKKSLTLNLKAEAGKAVFQRLAATADVPVENYRPGAGDSSEPSRWPHQHVHRPGRELPGKRRAGLPSGQSSP